MESSPVRVPPFSGCEVAVVFACCVRDKLRQKPQETRQLLAHIADVSLGTLNNLLIGEPHHSLTFSKMLSIIYALDCMPDFWARLTGSDAGLVEHIDAATASLQMAARKAADHPPNETLEDATARLILLRRSEVELAAVIRNTQELRAYRDASGG